MGKIRKVRACAVSTAVAVFLVVVLGRQLPAASLETVIQPGVGVGVLKLGDTVDDVYAKLGQRKADRVQRVAYKGRTEIWLTYDDMGMALVYDDARKRLERIVVTSKGLLVERTGIRVGSSGGDVEKYYGGEQRTRQLEGQNELWVYPGLGVSFTVNGAEQRVDSITVMPREKARR